MAGVKVNYIDDDQIVEKVAVLQPSVTDDQIKSIEDTVTADIQSKAYDSEITDSSTYAPQTKAVKAYVDEKTTDTVKTSDLIDLVYPVGSIYMSVANVSPATFIGGTWEQIKDTFLLAAGDTYTAGDTGGEATHKLTNAEMPRHKHYTIFSGKWAGTEPEYVSNINAFTQDSYVWVENGPVTHIPCNDFVGGDQAHNNMPPYLTIYMWKRTA